MQHLSTVDASFLHLETPEMPMHVATFSLFELPKGYKGDYYEDVKALLAKRMHLAPIFHRKLAAMPFELADPVWIEDDDVDLDYHVRSLTLRKPGTMKQLETLVARLHSSLLDRSRPLWEAYIIDGLQSGHVAYYWKAHHSGIDGKAGVELAKVFYDTTPEVREVPPPRRTRRTDPYQLGVSELLQAAAKNAATQYTKLGKLLPEAAKAMGAVGQLLAERKPVAGERRLDLGLAPRTPFNVSITNQRSYALMSQPLDELKAVGKRAGGTVNTVVMAMCASALRKFLLDRNELPEKPLIAMVPVSLRGADDNAMNNQVSAIRVDLATDIADPAERFKAIHTSSEDAKGVVRVLKPVLGADVPITGAPWLISSMASLYGRSGLADRLPSTGNVCISNVPGMPDPLYMAGARMLHYYPVSIPAHGMALNITAQSYAGQMDWGITACRRALSQAEADELVENLRQGLREIEALPAVAAA
ncbi:MAG TPA: wax ester/triacylglycerol synthase family O-acyltransferase [Burkholderiaceae bacterium]|nr:wax ester/triacylglycerol synthase family O-acyltransferase [Burkholderiaceae bacterium]